MEINEDFQMALDFIEGTGANLFLTGKAGTGKTTFLKYLRENSPKRMVVLAPTGIAAINANGQTIHSFFQLPLSPYVPGASFGGDKNKKYQIKKQKRDIIRSIDLVVIDEISMVRADVLDAVDNVLRRYRPQHNLPFGGVQLLLIGDMQQLAPVVKADEWEMLKQFYRTPYFFSSQALNALPYYTVELEKVYRQHDESFLKLLNNIRDYKADDATLAALNSRYIPDFEPPKGSDYIRLTTHNAPANKFNQEQLDKLSGEEFTFTAMVEGDFPASSYPAEEELTLKEGAQVMFIKNDSSGQGRYYNGLLADVTQLSKGSVYVKPKNSADDFELTMEEWTNSKYTLNQTTKEITEEVQGTFKQIPLRLAWAITIHKSQGLTFGHAIIDVSHSFAHGQTYVALSRCKTLEGMVLSKPLTKKAIIPDQTVDEYNRLNALNKPQKETLSKLQMEYMVKTLDELFSIKPVQQAVERIYRTANDEMFNYAPGLVADYRKMNECLIQLDKVAESFHTQYKKILAAHNESSQKTMQERIYKGTNYFRTQLMPLVELYQSTKPSFTNQATKDKFMEQMAELFMAMNQQYSLLEYFEENEFSPKTYLNLKANIMLKSEDAATTRTKKTTKVKRKK